LIVWWNGERREVDDATTVAELMEARGVPARGVAVAVDGAVLPRTSWTATPLAEGIRLEVLTAVQGG
jgi:sulfur carrier protein